MLRSILKINEYQLHVHLGWSKEERHQKQLVSLSFEVLFSDQLKECITDELSDHSCYQSLLLKIESLLSGKSFKLIEKLTYVIFQFLKKEIPDSERVSVTILKYPQIPNLAGGVTFCCEG